MSENSKTLRDMVAFQAADTGRSGGMQGRFSFLNGGPGSGLRTKLIIGLSLAAVSACGAAFLANQWFASQYDRLRADQPQGEQVVEVTAPTVGVVVAARDVAYGEPVSRSDLTLIDWPAASLPSGAFTNIEDVLSEDGSRFALARLTANEPLFEDKLSAPGQLVSLAAELEPGMKAVTVRVDDVLGVAGLIQPSDRVDVIWTRSTGNNPDPENTYAELLLQDVQVLAIDQRVNDGNEEASAEARVARAVTLEVDGIQAQKVALAASTGKLSLALRHIGAEVPETMRRVTMTELGIRGRRHEQPVYVESDADSEVVSNQFDVRTLQASSGNPADAEQDSETFAVRQQRSVPDTYAVVTVRRGVARSEYNVLSDPR